MNSNSDRPPDPTAGKFVIQIAFDPVTQRVEVQSSAPNQIVFLGMIEAGKNAILQQNAKKSPLAVV